MQYCQPQAFRKHEASLQIAWTAFKQKKNLQIGINNVLSLLVKLFGSDTASSEQEVFCLEMKAKHAYWTAGLERKS